MRIVAGKFRHRIIDMCNLETTRETQDSVREAIFNMIGPYFDGGICLDLFAGSGRMALEAYSRGMEKIYLNDLNNKALEVSRKNALKLGINDAYFYNLDYKEFLNKIDVKFDLIILDPPYKMNNIDDIINDTKKVLNDKGLIVFEMAKESKYKDSYDNLKLKKDKTYGIKRVLVYKGEANE
ncbi:MAG: 16S rRNA (guanine(966)-N(2))-methyltransferase RsmD [Acholeplasmatales bacterium]|nr:16S rRNA (guanine(966)-N(2))-methyltransferase RsmD [Acholeplasmatales bacterium]